jgi:RNA recognition motif-containing protein
MIQISCMPVSRAIHAQAEFSHLFAHPQDAGATVMSRKLYVGNIPFETNENDLQQLFAEAGAVESVNVVRDRETGRARGFAFVEMATDEAAQAAVSQLHDRSFGGRRLTVNEARPQTPRSGGGGGGYGRGGGGGSRRSEPRW